LAKQLRLVILRNGAFNARLDQDVENPNRFRLQAMYSSWAALQRADQRFTRDENAVWSELWTLHSGGDSPRFKRFLGVQHWIPEESVMLRLKPASPPATSVDGISAQN
ncbi:MAG TPA: MFS transporter, partial [Chthoniobacterales bacterium]|nr:MFS transporter [Chthoniobacterales bacterium]